MLDVKIQPPENAVEVVADSARAATFILHDEDHTIGNLLCDVLSEHPLVDYVGYSIVHPTQPKIQVRIQTRGLSLLHTTFKSTVPSFPPFFFDCVCIECQQRVSRLRTR